MLTRMNQGGRDGAIADSVGLLGAISVPDIMTPEQYSDLHRRVAFSPEQRLMLAVLEDGVRCFQNGRAARNGPRRRRRIEAQRWIVATDDHSPYSFEWVCEGLGIDTAQFRKALLDENQTMIRLPRRSPTRSHDRMALRYRRKHRRRTVV